MLIRYCAAHPDYFGYPRVLSVRWKGFTLSTSGGLCDACRERERERWRPDPYGSVLIPVPVELGPRTLGRRAFGAFLAAALAAATATTALLVVHPSDLIPSGGNPGLFDSGAQLAQLPRAGEDVDDVEPALARPPEMPRPTRGVETARAALSSRGAVTRAAARTTLASRTQVVTVAATRARPPVKARKAALVQAARPVIGPQSP